MSNSIHPLCFLKKGIFRIFLLLALCLVFLVEAKSQPTPIKKVVLQGFWWDYWNNNYPNGWSNYLADMAPRLRSMGVDAVWIPPSVKNNGQVVGYAPFDHYDLGDKFQKGRDTTRLGTKDDLLRMVAVLHANGIEVIQDIVPNHVIGAGSDDGSGGQDPAAPVTACTDNWKNFRYACYETPATDQSAADYLARKGRFPKNYHNFHPNTAHSCAAGLCDSNADAWCWQAFGPDVCYFDGAFGLSSNAAYNPDQSTYSPYNNGGIGLNNGYMRKHTREWLIWYKKQMGFDGVRIDAVKHFPPQASEDFLFNLQQQSQWASAGDGMFAVGEWVGGTAELDAWTTAVQGRAGTFDFNLRAFDGTGGLRSMIYGNGGFDMGALPGAQQNYRYTDVGGLRVHRTVPFVNNHDTYRPVTDSIGNITGWNSGQELSPHVDITEPRLAAAYAVICALDGNPQVFFEDVFNIANTGKRWTHRPNSAADLPANQDIVNIMRCHGALGFKDGTYKVPSSTSSFWNLVTSSNNNDDILVVERGGKAIIAATDSWSTDQDVWIDTDFPQGTVLKDYSGGYATTTTVLGPSSGGSANRVNIKVRAVGYPSYTYSSAYADHGEHYHGYAIWAPDGVNINAYSNPPILTTQEWEMENDLGDSHCESLGQGGRTPDNSYNPRVIGKIFPAAGSLVSYVLYPGTPANSLILGFYDLAGNLIHADTSSADSLSGSFSNSATRWVTMKVRNANESTPGQKCWLKASYNAPAMVNTDSFPAHLQVPVWTSNGGSGSWNDCRNWEEGRVAGCNDTVLIPHDVDFMPVPDSCFTGQIIPGFCLQPAIDSLSVIQPLCSTIATGAITIHTTSIVALEYSIDGGTTWHASPTFTGLTAGEYHLATRLAALPDCAKTYPDNPVLLQLPPDCCLMPSFSAPCTSGDYIDDFTMAGFSNLNSGCANPGSSNYASYVGTGPDVQIGETYKAVLRAGPSSQYFAVYIDLNDNGSFLDDGEFFDIGQASAGDTVSRNISIPASLDTGTIRLRIRSSNEPLTPDDGCNTNLASGETEEYDLRVFCPENLSFGAVAIASGVYNADKEIAAAGVVDSGAVVEFRSGLSVSLIEGFEVKTGGLLTVSMGSCFP